MTPATSCPENEVLQRFLLGQLPAEELDVLAEHVEQCRRCIEALHNLQPRDALLSAMENPLPPPDPALESSVLDGLMNWLEQPGRSLRN